MDARTPHLEQTLHARGWRPERCDRVALVLQGGGALGAYQAGVYQALTEAGIEPDWVICLLYTSPSPRDGLLSRMPSSA